MGGATATMISVDTREDGLRIVILGLIGFALIFPLCVWKHAEPIQADLLERSVQALSDNQYSLDVSVSGRDVTLNGYLDTEQQRTAAAKLVEQVYGVRAVKNETRVRGEPGAAGI